MSQLRRVPYLVEVITGIGLLFYLAQSLYFARSLDSIGDEGSYLYKGYLFAKGAYEPFQEYTFWTNKAPLSFLIPGYVQLWFGPGLAQGRYFAVTLGFLMMVALWLTARRLGGRIWAAVAVWVFALSFAQISIYSEAVSQGIVAFLLAWMFYLTLGGDRPLWQLVVGAAVAMLIVMTRQNMAVVPALLVGYVFWQYGSKAGWWSLAASGAVFVAFHVIYWPGILQIWVPWLPQSLTPFLDSFRVSAQLTQTDFVFEASTRSRLQSFVTGLHDHFFVFLGSLSALILWPRREAWESPAQFKTAVFLGATFFVLFGMHALASLPTDYCVHCFSGYQAFYTSAGLLFTVVVFSSDVQRSPGRAALLAAALLLFAASLGLYYHQSWGDWLLQNVPVPRLNRILRLGEFGVLPLQDLLTHTFGVAAELQRRIASAGAGLLLGLLVLFVIRVMYRSGFTARWPRASFVHAALAGCLILGTILPAMLEERPGEKDCSTEFLTYYEAAGRTFADLLPPESVVYWRGSGRHLAFMLYVENVRLFLPQIHAGGGYVVGDSHQLLRMGLYNEELDREWRQSADILVIWPTYFTEEFEDFVARAGYEPVSFDMGQLAQCEDELLVYRRTS